MQNQITIDVYEQPTFDWAQSKIIVASSKLPRGAVGRRYAVIHSNGFDGAFVLERLLNKFQGRSVSEFINNFFGHSYIDEELYDAVAGLNDVQAIVLDYYQLGYIDKMHTSVYRAEISGHRVKITNSNLFSPYLNAFAELLNEPKNDPEADIKLLTAKLFAYMSTFYSDWVLYDQLNMSANTSVLIVPSTQEIIKHFDIDIGGLSLDSLPSPVRDHGGINYKSSKFMKALNMCREDEDDTDDYHNSEPYFIYGEDDDGY